MASDWMVSVVFVVGFVLWMVWLFELWTASRVEAALREVRAAGDEPLPPLPADFPDASEWVVRNEAWMQRPPRAWRAPRGDAPVPSG